MGIEAGLLQALRARGVVVHAPEATTIEGVDPERFEAGVEIFPGCNLRGARSTYGAGTRLGRAGGGWFENVATGRGVDLYSGWFEDCVLLDGVTVRGHAELRGGTLLEEGCEAAHHVGYKMTVQLAWVVAGSLVNFCDALVAGGTSRKDHSEIGSTLALYNYTPWGDKFASLFGDVPRGVFQRERRIFVGGQTQIVSPVEVGFGTVLAAGSPLRHSLGEDRLVQGAGEASEQPFDAVRCGALQPKFALTLRYIGNLAALDRWYASVRQPAAEAAGDAHALRLIEAARAQLKAGIRERIKRLDELHARIPASLAAWEHDGAHPASARRQADHRRWLGRWPEDRQRLAAHIQASWSESTALQAIATALIEAQSGNAGLSVPEFMARGLDASAVADGQAALSETVADWAGAAASLP